MSKAPSNWGATRPRVGIRLSRLNALASEYKTYCIQVPDLDKQQFVVHSGRGLVAREESRFSANKNIR